MSRDGTYAICRRVNDGGGRAKVDRSGGEYWVYRLTDSDHAPQIWPSPPPPSVDHLPGDRLHQIHSSILAALKLSDLDRADLRARGLTDRDIEDRGYRSLGPFDRRRAMVGAIAVFGEATCLRVPGVILRRENRDSYVCLAGAPGLLVPIRNVDGHIIALKLRRRTNGSARYLYLSSVATGGPGPGAPVHVPKHLPGSFATVRVTEGELKADVSTSIDRVLTISIAGVGTWRRALPVLRALGARTCRLAFDADVRTNLVVATALYNLAAQLGREGFAVELETWAPAHKGIDDALAAGESIAVKTGTAAQDECRRLLGLAKGGRAAG